MDYTLADMVGMVARSRPDQVAATVLGEETTTYSFAELWDRIGDLADAVSDTEARVHGPMVAILLPNSLDAPAPEQAWPPGGGGAVPRNNPPADPRRPAPPPRSRALPPGRTARAKCSNWWASR